MKSASKIMLLLTPINYLLSQVMYSAAQNSDCTFDGRCASWSKWVTLGHPIGLIVLFVLFGVLFDWSRRVRDRGEREVER
jgi:hypothetical protein